MSALRIAASLAGLLGIGAIAAVVVGAEHGWAPWAVAGWAAASHLGGYFQGYIRGGDAEQKRAARPIRRAVDYVDGGGDAETAVTGLRAFLDAERGGAS